MSHPRARIGMVGLSGYAAELVKILLAEQNEPAGTTTLATFFALEAADCPERVADLTAQGIRQHTSFEALLNDDELNAIWLPVPIHLHRELGSQVLSSGRALILEKPVAGCVADHRALAQLAQDKNRSVLVGFQDVYAPGTAKLKQMLLAGELGAPRVVSVYGSWPRSESYYRRNASAGKRAVNGVFVNDSPITNAMAHFVNLALFLLGDTLENAAMPEVIDAQLLRAYEIETFDTCSIRAKLAPGDVEMIINLTHAASEEIEPTIEIDTDRGTLQWTFDGEANFQRIGAVKAEILTNSEPPRPHMMRTIGALLSHTDTPHLHANLNNTLAHTTLIEALGGVSSITTIPHEQIEFPADREREPRNVIGLSDAILTAASAGQMLSEVGFTA